MWVADICWMKHEIETQSLLQWNHIHLEYTRWIKQLEDKSSINPFLRESLFDARYIATWILILLIYIYYSQIEILYVNHRIAWNRWHLPHTTDFHILAENIFIYCYLKYHIHVEISNVWHFNNTKYNASFPYLRHMLKHFLGIMSLLLSVPSHRTTEVIFLIEVMCLT